MNDPHGVRRFADEQGTAWEVWEAHPRLAERRSLRERRAQRRDGPDRRGASAAPHTALTDYSGWLVFRSAREERRRTPIPEGWEAMSEAQLADLLHRSRQTGPFPRLKGERLRELGL